MRTRMLEIEGHRLAVISDNEDQSGPPVVLIHGITASVEFWLPTLPDVIRRKYCWHSLSLPGHTPSTMPPGYRRNDITADLFARVLSEAVCALTGGAPAHLVGWSTGGFSVVAIAASRPELAKSVVSFSGFAAGRWGGTIGALQILANSSPLGRLIAGRIFRALGQNAGLHEFIALRGAAHPRRVQQTTAWRDTFPSLHDGMARHDPAVLTDLFIRLRSLNIADQLPKIAAPVLIAGGNRDPFVPFSQTELLAGQIPLAELAVLDGLGHMFFAECTDRYHQLLTDWLSRQDAVAIEGGDPTGTITTGAAV